MAICEANPAGSKGVEIGRWNQLRAICADIAKADIIALDEDDIGSGFRRNGNRCAERD